MHTLTLGACSIQCSRDGMHAPAAIEKLRYEDNVVPERVIQCLVRCKLTERKTQPNTQLRATI